MTSLTHAVVSAPTLRPTSTRPLKRLLLVAGAAGLIGVGIDLRQDGSANALPTPAPQASARASFSTDYPVDMSLVDETALQPGASIAAYDTSVDSPADSPADRLPAAAAQPLADGDALDPGASVAAYGI